MTADNASASAKISITVKTVSLTTIQTPTIMKTIGAAMIAMTSPTPRILRPVSPAQARSALAQSECVGPEQNYRNLHTPRLSGAPAALLTRRGRGNAAW